MGWPVHAVGRAPGPCGPVAALLPAAALEGLKARIEAFDNPNRPYTSRVAPSSVKLYASDYDHLARVREWSSIGEGEDT